MKYDLTASQIEGDDLKTILALQKDCYLSESLLYNDYNIQPLVQRILKRSH